MTKSSTEKGIRNKKSSKASTSSKPKARAKSAADVPKRKAGNQGNFHGPPLDFLVERVDAYFAAGGKKRLFWDVVLQDFFERFDINKFLVKKLPANLETFFDKVEVASRAATPAASRPPTPAASRAATPAASRPPSSAALRAASPRPPTPTQPPSRQSTPTAAAILGHTAPTSQAPEGSAKDKESERPKGKAKGKAKGRSEDEGGDQEDDDDDDDDEDEEEEVTGSSTPDVKRQILIKCIKSWFSYRRTLKARESSGFEKFPYQLNDRGARPRRSEIHKFYMQLDEFRDKCGRGFDERHQKDPVPEEYRLAVRCEIAKELFEKEDREVRDRVIAECKADHEEAMEEWEALGEVRPVTDPVLRKLCRANIIKAAQPFLDWMRAQTGYHFTLMGGCGPEERGGKFSMITVHSGKTVGVDPKDLAQHNPDAFKGMMGGWLGYLMETVPPEFLEKDSAPANIDHIAAPTQPTDVNASGPAEESSSKEPPGSKRPKAAKGKRGAKPKKKGRQASGTPHETPEPDGWNEAASPRDTPARTPPPRSQPPPPPTTPSLRRGCTIGASLAAEVQSLPDDQRRARMAVLAKLPQMALDRENNIINNNRLMAQLGVKNAAATIRGENGDIMGGNMPGGEEGEEGEKGEEGEGDDYEDAGYEEDEIAPTTPPQSQWPAWLLRAREMLEEGITDENWEGLVGNLIAMEASYGFEDGKKGLSAVNRPSAVQWWISRARTSRVPKDVVDHPVEKFIEDFWSWWDSLNPEWRRRDNDGRLRPGNDGAWGGLRVPGHNGMWSVCACLRWWWEREGGVDTDSEWHDAVKDVSWAMYRMAKTSDAKRVAAEDPPGASRPAKRRRR